MIPKKATNPSDSTEYSVVGIDYGAFYYATRLTSVTLPEGLEYIDSCAFRNSSLKSIEIPASVTRLGSEDKTSPINNPVFSSANRHDIESVTFAENSQLKIIGSKAFQYCENLKELDIPDGVTYIGSMAFGGCDSLTELEIPAGVTDLGFDNIPTVGIFSSRYYGALDDWDNLKNVTFAEGSPYEKDENYVLYCNDDTLVTVLDDTISSVTVRDGTKEIAARAFFKCSNLKTVYLPDGLETIGKDAFTYAPSKNTADANILEYINIPASVTSIGENFLKGALKNDGSSIIVMQGDTPPEIGSGAFVSGNNTEYEFTLIYPAEAKTAYVDAGLVSEDDDKGISFSLSLEPTTLDLLTGDTKTIIVTATKPEGNGLKVTSSNTAIATAELSADGNTITVTAKGAGTATISVSIANDNIALVTKTCTLTVKDAWTVKLDGVEKKVEKGKSLTFPSAPTKPGYIFLGWRGADGTMYGAGTAEFSPNATLTRAMVWAILARLDGETITGDTWAADAQEWAVAKGVSDGTNPMGAVTREQLVTMLWRFRGEPAADTQLTAPDAGTVSDWAATAMHWAVENGIIEGDENGMITPTATATRAQAAAIFMRFIEG